jgi:hypothetical protein
MKNILLASTLALFGLVACDKTPDTNDNTGAKLLMKIKFDNTLPRLDAFGQPATIPAGNAAQNPTFNDISLHNIELVTNEFTPIQGGAVVYMSAENTTGGARAVDFDKAIIKKDGETYLEVPLSDIQAGTYQFIRTSVTYQNYDVRFNINNVPVVGNIMNQKGTIASFVGFNTYIASTKIANKTHIVNDDKLQGYWAFETQLSSPYDSYNQIYSGDAVGTTVVNPIHNTTPIPVGSCLVTGRFVGGDLVITGNETEDIVVELAYCTNKSFEWKDTNGNGELDIDASGGALEPVVDMGLRGLQARVK